MSFGLEYSSELGKSYVADETVKALTRCDVMKYQSTLASRVDNICLEMGYCDTQKFEQLTQKLTKEINSITTDESEKDKLHNYAKKIKEIGINYHFLMHQVVFLLK